MDDNTKFGIYSRYGYIPKQSEPRTAKPKPKPAGYNLVEVVGNRESVIQSALPNQYGLLVSKRKELMRQACYANGVIKLKIKPYYN
jgi:hypothetical protein